MAAPVFDHTKPDPANPYNTDLDAIRENSTLLLLAAAGEPYLIPGWTPVVGGADKSKPDYIELTNGSRKMRWTFGWDGAGNATSVVLAYDRGLGAGYETLAGGTFTLTYDGSNNWTGGTPS